jgi:hypothetical protein
MAKRKVELLTTYPSEIRDALSKLVEQKVAEALASDSGILQPFMQPKRVSIEIRKNQNVIETLKFKYYFEDWGCMICGTKDAIHASLGMCQRCHGRVLNRMVSTLQKASDERPTFEEPKDLEALAREALAPSIEVLAKKRGRPARTWRVRD